MVNPARLKQELEQGFAREEFEIVGDGIEGDWLINVKYLGNTNAADETPSFMMCRIIYNFGKKDQREEFHSLRLSEKESDYQLVKLKF